MNVGLRLLASLVHALSLDMPGSSHGEVTIKTDTLLGPEEVHKF